ncbi:hypothetical protein AOLI_G00169070 [Acnodon oligacanthus]
MKMDDDRSDKEESDLQSTKVHTCQHCSATFCSPYHLRRHVYTHTGERPYWCSQCNLGFIQKYRFRNHRVTHHGETQGSFHQDLAKKRKTRSDSGEKPTQSEPCKQTFSESTAASLEPYLPTEENATSKTRET